MKSTELWRNHFPGGGDFSYKLRNMEMSNCKKLLVLFSPHLVPGFHHLERLYLDNCKSLEVVFDLGELTVEGVHKFAMINKLDSIQICDLLCMTHVWNKVPRNFEGFNNLTSLYIRKCHSLRYLFSPSIAKCLVKLQLVDVGKCREMEEVVSKRDEEGQKNVMDIVFFPQLQELKLYVLPNIKCFGPYIGSTKTHHNNANTSISSPIFNGKIALTSSEAMENRGTNSMKLWRDNYGGGFSYGLRRMIVKGCHNLLVLFPHLIQVFHHLEKLDITKCNTLKLVFDLEGMIAAGEHKVVILGQLYEMDLFSLPKMTHVWKNVPKDFKGFHNLISLSIRYCDGLSYLFSPLIAKCLVKLVRVLVRKCEVMEEVVSKRDEKCEEDKRSAIDNMILLPKLEQLELEDLQSLISLGPRAYAFDKQSFGAPNDGSDVTHDPGNPNSSIPTPIFNEKIALTTSMEDVEIRGTNSTELWRDQFAGRRFYYGWRRIRLNGCHKLSVLFTSHLIQGFYCLEKLQASRCDSLEVVFDLEKLMVGGGEHRVVMLNQLDQIQISYLPRMTHVWKKAPINFEGFHNLTNVEIDNCGSLKYLFSPFIAKCLGKLRKLSVEECGEMEEVVSRSWEEEEEDGDEDQRNAVDIIFFPKLHELELSSLPSLVCFGPGGAPDAFDRLSLEAPNVLGSTDDIHHEGNFNTSISSPIFTEELPFSGPQSSNLPSLALVQIGRCQLPAWSLYNLTRVKVHECHKLLYLFPHNIVVRLPVLQHLSISNCDNMKYVFCSSTVRSLAQLRYLSIVGCKMMEVVVKEEDEVEADRWSKLVVPSLISLMLTSLPNLRGICFGMLAFEWPSLTSLVIKFCWKMRIFTSGYSSTPILDSVLVNSNRHILEKGDLNTTLTSVEQKDPDNIAFKEEGILTSNGFLVAGMYLASKCRSWYWKTDRRHKDRERIWEDLREFLITKNVPCLTRARASSSIVVEEDKNEADECGDGDDKNIPRPRTYSVSITYDEEDKIPRLWLKGFDESKRVLPPELVHEDIAELHPQEFITVEMHPQLHEKQVSLYGDLTPRHIKDFSDNLAKQGFQPNVKHYLQLLLELYAPRIPTIQYCFHGA